MGMAFTEHARDAKVAQTGSCFRRGFSQAGSRTNFSLCPLIMHIQVRGSWGAEMRPFSAEDRDTQGHLPSREEIGREKCAGPTERKWSSRKDQGTARANAWRLESGQGNSGVTLLLCHPSFPLLLSPTSLPVPLLGPSRASSEAHGPSKPSADPQGHSEERQGHTAALSTPRHKRQPACGFSTSLSGICPSLSGPLTTYAGPVSQ